MKRSRKNENSLPAGKAVDLKTSEIDDLLADQINKTKELNDKDLKIKALEERIKVLEGQCQE